jgi:hypothetical protein
MHGIIPAARKADSGFRGAGSGLYYRVAGS